MSLKISRNLSLPDEAVTQTFAILAKRGVGKTYTASVMVEEMLKANLPVVVLDPIGVWWGLRSSADGKKPGLPITIAGGDHADVPITPDNGEILANLVVDEKISIVIDLSHFRKGEQTRFVTDFAETLYHRNRTALHVIADEADAFAPQRPFGNEARMLGAMEDLVRRGRARGIGMTLITQRPSVLNKNVLTQVEVIIALRLIAPQDRKALDEWVKIHAEEEQRQEFEKSLPSLEIGEAWFWSPGWLDLFQRVKVRKRETLDSSSTPKAGQTRVEARNLADVDLDKIRSQLAETIAKVEADDPKALKRRIIELERQLSKREPQIEVREVEVQIIPDEQIQALTKATLDMQNASDKIIDTVNAARNNGLKHRPPKDYPEPSFASPTANKTPEVVDLPKAPETQMDDGKVSNYAKSLLETLAARYPMKMTRSQISVQSGRKPRSSAFASAMKELVSRGYINKVNNQFEITDKGSEIAGIGAPTEVALRTPEETRQMWLNALPSYESDLLRKLIEFYPASLTRDELSKYTGRSLTSSAFHSSISSLLKNDLIDNSNGEVRASDNLFTDGAKA